MVTQRSRVRADVGVSRENAENGEKLKCFTEKKRIRFRGRNNREGHCGWTTAEFLHEMNYSAGFFYSQEVMRFNLSKKQKYFRKCTGNILLFVFRVREERVCLKVWDAVAFGVLCSVKQLFRRKP